MSTILDEFEDNYKRYGLMEYIYEVLDGQRIDYCYRKIYANVFVKIQTQKCDQYKNEEYRKLKNNMWDISGKVLMSLINKDES